MASKKTTSVEVAPVAGFVAAEKGFGVLDEVGAIDEVARAGAPEIAAFLGALTRYATERDYGDDAPPIDARYFEILTRLAPPLVAATQPVDLRSWGWNDDGNYAPDVLETALELGLTLEVPKPEATLEYDEPFSKNHARLVARPEFAPLVTRGVASAFGREPFETCAKGKPWRRVAGVCSRRSPASRGAGCRGCRKSSSRWRTCSGPSTSRRCRRRRRRSRRSTWRRRSRGRFAEASSTSSRGRLTRRSSRASGRRRSSRRTDRVCTRSCARVARSWSSTGRTCCGATTCRPR